MRGDILQSFLSTTNKTENDANQSNERKRVRAVLDENNTNKFDPPPLTKKRKIKKQKNDEIFMKKIHNVFCKNKELIKENKRLNIQCNKYKQQRKEMLEKIRKLELLFIFIFFLFFFLFFKKYIYIITAH